MTKFIKSGKSLYLWTDNTPYTSEVNYLLENLFDGMYMEGDYFGGKLI